MKAQVKWFFTKDEYDRNSPSAEKTLHIDDASPIGLLLSMWDVLSVRQHNPYELKEYIKLVDHEYPSDAEHIEQDEIDDRGEKARDEADDLW